MRLARGQSEDVIKKGTREPKAHRPYLTIPLLNFTTECRCARCSRKRIRDLTYDSLQ